MIEPKKELSNEHTFGSRPSWWPLMRRGVAYWIAKDNNVRFSVSDFLLTHSLPEYLMEFCKVTLTFASADEIL